MNDVVRNYFQGADDQLTHRSTSNIAPMRTFYAQMLNADIGYMTHAPWTICKLAIQGSRFSFHQNDSFLMQIRRLSQWRARLVWVTVMPIGFGLYLFDQKQPANTDD